MSRFFANGDSSTEESSEESSSSSESEASEDEKPQAKKKVVDEPRVKAGPRKVISHKDKRYDEMQQTIKLLKNAVAINDWNVVSDEFANINKQIAKAGTLIAEDGVPSFYIACIAKLAETVEQTAADKDKVKKMSKTNAKSLIAMKQNTKKNNINYEAAIAKYIENPVEEEEEKAGSGSDSGSGSESDSSSSGSDSDSDDEKKKKKPVKAKKGSGSDEDDSEEWPSDSTSSEEDEDAAPLGKGISKWMKTGDGSDSDSDDGFEKVAKKKKERVQGPGKKKEVDDTPKDVKETPVMVLNEENVKKKLDELMAQRGKRGTSKKDQIAQLEHLSTAVIPPVMGAMVLVHLIAAQFDTSMTRNNVAHMPIAFEITEDNGNTKPSRTNSSGPSACTTYASCLLCSARTPSSPRRPPASSRRTRPSWLVPLLRMPPT